ncbi:MAG: hydroxymethylbilane synthase [Bryobacteraceae bacterium]|nr:hydroxymethylbilane synthase [Bryobacteraceae bacterium]
MKLRIGTRGSQLALWQARHIAGRLARLGVETEIEVIRTTGDRITDVPLARVGSKGLFTKEIEEALLEGRIDLAVHSLKDLPVELPAGLALAAVPERESPFDAVVGRRLEELPPGARVGTSSLRRAAQLRRLRPDLVIEDIRGNLDTRLRKLDEGRYDAILLASAGLARLGWKERIAEVLPPEKMCPAVGQGALAVETRAEPDAAFSVCAQLDDAAARCAVEAERALLQALGGGCQVPLGAYAELAEGRLRLRAVVADPSNGEVFETVREGSAEAPQELGRETALALLEAGARRIIVAVNPHALPLAGHKVVVTRAPRQAGGLSARLRALGAEVIELPLIDFEPLDFPPPDWISYDWAVFTSANGVEFFFRRVEPKPGPRLCAIGPATAAALRRFGLEPELVPGEYVAESVVQAFAQLGIAGRRVLLPRAAEARDVIPGELRRLGATVDVVPVYRTVVPEGLEQKAREMFSLLQPDWVTLTSSSTVRHLLAVVPRELLEGVRLASIGPVTSRTAREAGLGIAVEAERYTVEGLAEAMADWARAHASDKAH